MKEDDLVTKIARELDRILWRRRDRLKETQKMRQVYKPQKLKQRLATLRQIKSPSNILINLSTLSGDSFPMHVQQSFIDSLNAEGIPNSQPTTIGDVKSKVEEECGIVGAAQILYCPESCSEFDDDMTIGALDIVDGQTLLLIIDKDRAYWAMHAALVRKHQEAITHVVYLLQTPQWQVRQQSPSLRPRVVEFLKNCKKALICLAERRATHKPRSLTVLTEVEGFLRDMVTPVFDATSSAP